MRFARCSAELKAGKIEEYGHASAEWFKQVLEVPHGIPSHDTFRRVLAGLDPDEFTQCVHTCTQARSERNEEEIVAVDGKTRVGFAPRRGAQNFAVLRHIALKLLQRESSHRRGITA